MIVKPKSIAIVDDDESVRVSIGRLVRAAGFNPVSYSSAEEFLEDKQWQIHCLVLDICLGGMSGLDLQKHLAAIDRSLPIIFITGHEKLDTPQLLRPTGCVACFVKPVAGNLLLDAIRRAVGTVESSAN